MHKRLGEQADNYSNPKKGPESVLKTAKGLVNDFANKKSEMRPVVESMFDHFYAGTGEDFRNDTLTKKVFAHESPGRFMNTVEEELSRYLNQNNGSFIGATNPGSSVITVLNETRPRFNFDGDNSNGLRIAINDTWGNNIRLINLKRKSNNVTYTIKVAIYDHFGLDETDTKFANTLPNGFQWFDTAVNPNPDGFAAWYVLQHYSETKNKHKAFVDYSEKEFEFSVTIS
jgi:hypothetical protein